MMPLQNPVSLARKTPLLFRLGGIPLPRLSVPKLPRACANQVRLSGLAACASSASLNSSRSPLFKVLGSSGAGISQLGSSRFRVLAVSGGGSGGGGYGDGNSGGGGGEGANDGGSSPGGNNWSLLSWYLSLLAKYPVLTKAVTSGILNFLGDLICQLVIDKVPSPDFKRTFLFAFLGLVLVGPTLHFWYLYLSKLVTIPGAGGAFTRLILDQFLFSPVFIGVFLAALTVLEGKPAQVMPRLQQEWFSSIIANWQLWIPFQFLNFRFVPQQFQVLAANVIALAWNVILSFKAHRVILEN
ncbi:unnamed protein product [Linum tenue]|uniref:Uncharacterized protein n=1 Tax=Linum tenue TaxID=586396 RepID=A0AAV0GQD2_9ROSI|nr:unnamed protein product [Linum tenue]